MGCCGSGQKASKLEDSSVPRGTKAQTVWNYRKRGTDVIISQNGTRVAGTGTVLGNTVLAQDKSYFEIKIIAEGEFCVGVALKECNLHSQLGKDAFSWVLDSDGSILHRDTILQNTQENFSQGDVIGVAFDQSDLRILNFYVNGAELMLETRPAVTGIKGEVYPAVCVQGAAVIEANFGDRPWSFPPPLGFQDGVIAERSLL